MAQYMLIRHLDSDERDGVSGTMTGYGFVEADSDDEAVQKLAKNWNLTYKDADRISDDWSVENKEFSVVRLCVPPKLG